MSRDHIHIQTTQNVRLQYEISSIGDRIGAYLIDILIILGVTVLLWFLFDTLVGFSDDTISIIAYFVILSPLAFYHLLFEIFNNGQSIGKRILKIKVIRLDGTEPSLGNFFIRWLTRILEISGIGYGIAVLVILINGKGQRLGDIASGTTVAKVKKRISLNDTIMAFTHENYTPVYVMSQTLSARDIEVIKEAIQAFVKYKNYYVVNACAHKVKTLFNINPNEDARPSYEFLTDVVNDYSFYTSLDEK